MVLGSLFLVPQILEQGLARLEILATRVERGDVRRERSHVLVVLGRIGAQGFARQRPFLPRDIEGVL